MADKSNKGILIGLVIAIVVLFVFGYAVSGRLKTAEKEAARLSKLVQQKDVDLDILSESVRVKGEELDKVKKELEAAKKTLDAVSAELDNARKDLEDAAKKIEELKGKPKPPAAPTPAPAVAPAPESTPAPVKK